MAWNKNRNENVEVGSRHITAREVGVWGKNAVVISDVLVAMHNPSVHQSSLPSRREILFT